MLLKCSQYQRRSRLGPAGKPQRLAGSRVVTGKGGHRRGMKGAATKRLNNSQRTATIASKKEFAEAVSTTVDPCDNSNDSGLGFDHHLEYSVHRPNLSPTLSDQEYWSGVEECGISRKRKLDIKLEETDDANDNFTFPCQQSLPLSRTPTSECMGNVARSQTVTVVNPATLVAVSQPGGGLASGGGAAGAVGGGGTVVGGGKASGKRGQLSQNNQSTATSRNGCVQLQIISQPEMQHRARYQTEGSRGAVKDRSGNGFPVVKLTGYDKTATLEVYIGTDQGKVAPHMFYQACRVSGKNSTPCVEQKVNGTVLIKIEFEPSKDMVITCDCVGILKERNVDVEHRFPDETPSRSKKKSTRCRMVFRTMLMHDDGTQETLQVTSQPIVCTQPPGIPEICKKSLSSCECTGGWELFILGKNFLKDTKVMFCEGEPGTENYWEQIVQPDKDFLQQSHLVCVIPPYKTEDIKEPVLVRLQVVSSGKRSEAHSFVYTAHGSPPLQALPQDLNTVFRAMAPNLGRSTLFSSPRLLLGAPLQMLAPDPSVTALQKVSHTFVTPNDSTKVAEEESILGWDGAGLDVAGQMLPPPLPLMRRSPIGNTASGPSGTTPPAPAASTLQQEDLKREPECPASPSIPELQPPPSMATLRRFVSEDTPLPALTVDTYFSRIENKTAPHPPPSSLDNISIAAQPIGSLFPEQTVATQALLGGVSPTDNRVEVDSPASGVVEMPPPNPATLLSPGNRITLVDTTASVPVAVSPVLAAAAAAAAVFTPGETMVVSGGPVLEGISTSGTGFGPTSVPSGTLVIPATSFTTAENEMVVPTDGHQSTTTFLPTQDRMGAVPKLTPPSAPTQASAPGFQAALVLGTGYPQGTGGPTPAPQSSPTQPCSSYPGSLLLGSNNRGEGSLSVGLAQTPNEPLPNPFPSGMVFSANVGPCHGQEASDSSAAAAAGFILEASYTGAGLAAATGTGAGPGLVDGFHTGAQPLFPPAPTSTASSDQQPPKVAPSPAAPEAPKDQVVSELTQMSDHDLLSYINPSCFDQV